jgi:hypothetical protein
VGVNRNDLYSRIKDFLRRDGANDWARFLAAMNQRAAAALSDGNPSSTTALLAGMMFNNFGSQMGDKPGGTGQRGNSVSITFDADSFRPLASKASHIHCRSLVDSRSMIA